MRYRYTGWDIAAYTHLQGTPAKKNITAQSLNPPRGKLSHNKMHLRRPRPKRRRQQKFASKGFDSKNTNFCFNGDSLLLSNIQHWGFHINSSIFSLKKKRPRELLSCLKRMSKRYWPSKEFGNFYGFYFLFCHRFFECFSVKLDSFYKRFFKHHYKKNND